MKKSVLKILLNNVGAYGLRAIKLVWGHLVTVPSLLLLYGCQSWTLTADLEGWVQTFENKCYRRMLAHYVDIIVILCKIQFKLMSIFRQNWSSVNYSQISSSMFEHCTDRWCLFWWLFAAKVWRVKFHSDLIMEIRHCKTYRAKNAILFCHQLKVKLLGTRCCFFTLQAAAYWKITPVNPTK